MNNNYCQNLHQYKRFKTRTVDIGNVPLGGDNPIRVQSMTTTNTLNTTDTIEQSIRMIKAGSEYVRITAPSIKEAKNLKNIQQGLKSKGYSVPIIADIHFTPNAAEIAAQIVPKVRINPGNYADRKRFNVFEISDQEYNLELDRIYERFSPLVKVCKENGTVMRIGTNHGSLSDRIMNRYGDTPLGMVESAMEFIRICEDGNFFDIVLSMKSSNPIVMINAYRLLVKEMIKNNMSYPLHLGVTEAGDGMPGRIKSSIGIGSLLEDGIGDTIRVSLTEDPENEIPVALNIRNRYLDINKKNKEYKTFKSTLDPFNYKKRESILINDIGFTNVPRVIIDLTNRNINYNTLEEIGYEYLQKEDKWLVSDMAADYVLIDKHISFDLPVQLSAICKYERWISLKNIKNIYPLFQVNEYLSTTVEEKKFIYLQLRDLENKTFINKIKNDNNAIIIIKSEMSKLFIKNRNLFFGLINLNIKNPVLIFVNYNTCDDNFLLINSSIEIGGLLIDGLGDGICLSNKAKKSLKKINEISFEILQATRTRISKTEYISCPSCGRTQFDLQETTAKVREKTSHLKGLKIAVMGCIVNGPGEMADADYGYVGTGLSKISLYKGQNIIKKNVKSNDAVNQLIALIKENGDWIDPI